MVNIWTGSVDVLNGNPVVDVNTGDALTEFNCSKGSAVPIGGVMYFVLSRQSTTQFTLTRNYEDADANAVTAEISPVNENTSSLVSLVETLARVEADINVLDKNSQGLFFTHIGVTGNDDPGPGNLAFDTATPADITAMYVDNLDANSTNRDVSSLLAGILLRTRIRIRSLASTAYLELETTADSVDETGRHSFALKYIAHDGIIADGEAISMFWVQNGEGLKFDVALPFASRSTYDAQPAKFVFLSTDGDGAAISTPLFFMKNTSGSGDWSTGVPFQGEKGNFGGADYKFNTATGDIDPTAGHFQLDHAVFASASRAYISETDGHGIDLSSLLDQAGASTSPIKAYMILKSKTGSCVQFFKITAATIDATPYKKHPIAHVGGVGTLSDGEDVGISYQITGNVGSQGEIGLGWLSGSAVPDDGDGRDGDQYFRTSTGDVYAKAAGTWGTPTVNLKGADGASVDYRGAWLTTTAYVVGDFVTNDDQAWVCSTAHTAGADDDEPGVGANYATYWDLASTQGPGGINGSGLNGIQDEKTTTYAVVVGDKSKTLVFTGTSATTFTYSAVGDLGATFFNQIINDGDGVLTLAADGAELIDDASSIDVQVGQSCLVMANSSALRTSLLSDKNTIVGTKITKITSSLTHTLDPRCVSAEVIAQAGGAKPDTVVGNTSGEVGAAGGGGAGANIEVSIAVAANAITTIEFIIAASQTSANSAGNTTSFLTKAGATTKDNIACVGGGVPEMTEGNINSVYGVRGGDVGVLTKTLVDASTQILREKFGLTPAGSGHGLGDTSIAGTREVAQGGEGASSPFGRGGRGGGASNSTNMTEDGEDAEDYGAGGGGGAIVGSDTNPTGGDGGPGVAYVKEYLRAVA